jgi:protein SCO1
MASREQSRRPNHSALWALAVIACLLFAGCGAGAPAPQVQERRYHLRGTVVSIDRAQQHIVVDAEEIPGFMGAMAMPYPVADVRTLDLVAPGDQITADVVVSDAGAKLDNVVVVKKADATKSPTGGNLQQKRPTDAVPDFTLVNQDGKQIHLGQYRGQALLLTFIYTRCPLPDYCPLMSHNFAEIEKALAKKPAVYAKTHLLSISFDSDYDTPEVLRNYRRAYTTDPHTYAHWEFATIPKSARKDVASYFNLFLDEQSDQIGHSMSTAIIAPDGNLYRSYSGNDWKPTDVLADLTQSAVPQS